MKTKDTVLTGEERDVLILAALHQNGKFLSNYEIGRRLGITTNRVNMIVQQACIKLGAHDKKGAILLALKRGEINLSDFWSPDELVKLFNSLDTNILRRMTDVMRQRLEHKHLLENNEQADITEIEGSDSTEIKMKERKTKVPVLTKDEQEVLVLAGIRPKGKLLSIREISQHRGESISKVKILIHQACVKLEAHNRIEAIYLALKRGEINLNEINSLDQIAEQFSSLSPDVLRRMANIVRQGLEYEYLPSNDRQIILKDRKQDGILTKAEREVLIFAGLGYTNKEIADRLCISTATVATYLYQSFRKLGVNKRIDAFVLALKQREIRVSDLYSFSELLEYLAPLGAEFIEEIAQRVSKKLGQEFSYADS